MYVAIEEHELDALRGADYVLTSLYIYLKQHMDYKTLVVGQQRRISYQSISEALHIEPRQGVKGSTPSKPSIRRMIDQLVKLGLIAKHKLDTLVFKCKLATAHFYDQEKVGRGVIPNPDTPRTAPAQVKTEKADTPKKAKADTPHYVTNTISNTTTTNKVLSSDQTANNCSSSNKLIYPKTLDPETIKAFDLLIAPFDTETRQQLIDEVQGYIDHKKIQTTPTALLNALVGRCNAGTFIANYAIKVRNARKQRIKQAEKPNEPQPAIIKKDKEKNAAKMAEVMKLFKRGKPT